MAGRPSGSARLAPIMTEEMHPPTHGDTPAPTAPPSYPVDAPVSTMSGVVFVTTGRIACESLGVSPDQVAFTTRVAQSIAVLLRTSLQERSLEGRQQLCAVWQVEEDARVPSGRVIMDQRAVHLGIEPLGAGTMVIVMWEHVPALILQLESATLA